MGNQKLINQVAQEIENYIKENPLDGFDICSQCGITQEANTMQDINEVDFNIFCDDCYPEKEDV